MSRVKAPQTSLWDMNPKARGWTGLLPDGQKAFITWLAVSKSYKDRVIVKRKMVVE
ncbi:MAG: hypothetical protein H5U07_06375 [Candidatus Aminicenantes bacterium]|nr:hypothetical protein [Candidatus Aminicenantes bacterium]